MEQKNSCADKFVMFCAFVWASTFVIFSYCHEWQLAQVRNNLQNINNQLRMLEPTTQPKTQPNNKSKLTLI